MNSPSDFKIVGVTPSGQPRIARLGDLSEWELRGLLALNATTPTARRLMQSAQSESAPHVTTNDADDNNENFLDEEARTDSAPIADDFNYRPRAAWKPGICAGYM
jgi:hypothetical protein